MAHTEESGICVNFFARELQHALAKKGLSLWAICSHTDIAREVVHRLQQGLLLPGNFSMLNPDDLDKVIVAFKLHKDPSQIMRLRATIVANSIMRVLVHRVYVEDAYAATEEVYKRVVQGMQKGEKAFSSIRKGGSPDLNVDEVLESILPLVDYATSALQMSVGMPGEVELEHLWQARTGYEIAQRALDEVGDDVKTTAAWQHWYATVQKELAEVKESIEDAMGF
jgi:hypothetical protein